MVFRGEKVVFGPNVQSGYGLGRFFRNVGRVFKPVVNPVLKEVKDIGLTVGTNLLQNVVQDVLTGQSPKASIKARGKQSRDKALQLALQKSLQKQKGRGLFNMEVVKKKQKGKGIGRFWGKKSKTKSKTPANLKRKAILGKIGNVIKPILKETKGIVSNVGKDFLGNVIQDAIAGKNVKTALKARGKEAAIDATNMSIQRVLEKEIKKENSDLNEKGTKRKRSRSRSKSVSKKKRSKPSSKQHQSGTKPVRKRNSTKKHGKNRNKREPSDIFSSSKQKGGMAEVIFSKRHGFG